MIHGDPEPFSYCKILEAKYYKIPQVPKNDEGPTTSYVELTTLTSTSKTKKHAILDISEIKVIIQDNGCGDYRMKKSDFVIGELPQSPRTHGKPQPAKTSSHTFKENPSRFRS